MSKKKQPRKKSLVARITLVTATLVLGSTLAGGAAAYFVASRTIAAEIQFTGKSLVHSLSGSIMTIITKPGAEDELQMVLNTMLEMDAEGRISDATIIAKDLTVLAAKDASQVGRSYSQFAGLGDLTGIRLFRIPGHSTRIAAPIQWGRKRKRTLGYVVLSLGEQTFTTARRNILLTFSSLFLVATLLSIIIIRLALSKLLRPVVQLGEAAQALAEGNSDYPLTKPKRRDEVGIATESFLFMREAQKVFVRFSNPALVREIQSGRAPDTPQEVKLAIGFGDGVRFTDWSNAHTAVEISHRLTQYFTLFGQIVVAQKGIVEKFIGDAVMSYYGLHGDAGAIETSRGAVRTHVYGQHVFRIANIAFSRYHRLMTLRFRFGIATGKCVVGPMGAHGVKLDYTLIGNAVNLAARLEGIAEPGGLAIDNFTYLNVDGEQFLTAQGPQMESIKGFEKLIPIYRVTGFKQVEENERLKEFLLDFFERDFVKEILHLDHEQYEEFYAELVESLHRDSLTLEQV